MTHIVVGLGSNIDREEKIAGAVQALRVKYGQLDISPIYETESVGFEGYPFLNLVVGLYSSLSFVQMRNEIREIETSLGRSKGRKTFDDRVLDIDLLLYGAMHRAEYNIPRDEIAKYAFVLKPLSDLYPEHVHPTLGQTFLEMWQSFDCTSQRLVEYSEPGFLDCSGRG